MEGLHQSSANYEALSPLSFLKRAASIHAEKDSVIYGSLRFSWSLTYERCLKLASALVHHLQILPGDIVAAFAPNIPALYELHFAIPMAGAIISPLNPRLNAKTLSLLLQQLEPKIIFVDYQFLNIVLTSLNSLSIQNCKQPHIILIPELMQTSPSINIPKQNPSQTLNYDDLLSMGNLDFVPRSPKNECDPISINFTSGTTGLHKGVIYSHRATYLNSLANIYRINMCQIPVFLWTVDMFRCNGWCFIWALAALGGTNICLRKVSAELIFDSVFLHKVTHLCGPPTIFKIISEAPESIKKPLPHPVDLIIAGAFPVRKILEKLMELGFCITHSYGMTETLGPVIFTPWKDIDNLEEDDKMKCGTELGLLQNFVTEVEINVKDPETMKNVTNDDKTLGEIMFRGNTLMSRYFKNPKLTQAAFKGDWYRTGDIGTRHPSGSIRMIDRAKDIIIISQCKAAVSTLEVEGVLLSYPKVLEAAVLGKYDECLGETWVCGFVKLKDGVFASVEEILEFCGNHLYDHMVPRTIVFGDLPVNSTGKVQKFVLKGKTNNLGNMESASSVNGC